MSGLLDPEHFERDHRWAPDRMSDYLDRELDASEHGRMERHLSECDGCRRLLEGLRRTLDLLHRLSGSTTGPDPQSIAASVRVRLGDP